MKAHISLTTAETIPLTSIEPHPANARRGDIDAIADSLNHHGQYKPIVVNKRTNQILAGNHTYKAAKRLRWGKIAVVWVDVDEPTARKILIADNRTNDLAHYDEQALIDLLATLPDLDGTGFTPDELNDLDTLLDGPLAPAPSSFPPDNDEQSLILGHHRGRIDPDAYDVWSSQLEDQYEGKKPRIIAELRNRLHILTPTPVIPKPAETTPTPPATITTETVPLTHLTPYPGNARTGDIGAISESLHTLGQYRPIIANQNGQILAGNHTYQAAKMLGWTEIAVTYIDVDETEAAKIVLVDNRTADKATYDTDALKQLLTSLPDPLGTGYGSDDLADLLGGGPSRPGPDLSGKTTCRIGDYAFRHPRHDIERWANHTTLTEITEHLGLPPASITE
jgi:ParB-like chromosome segregation protein Spo0J